MDKCLLDFLEIKSTAELRRAMIDYSRQNGFETASISVVLDRPGGTPLFCSLSNMPEGYEDIFNDMEGSVVDPVMQHLKNSPFPLPWGKETYTASGQGAMWEAQAAWGVSNGVGLALHLGQGEHFVIGFDSPHSLGDNIETMRKIVAVQGFAVYALEAARRLMFPLARNLRNQGLISVDAMAHAAPVETESADFAATATLSLRELECLKWSAAGKTAYETGELMNLSEAMVKKYFTSIRGKLGAKTKSEALGRALRMGILRT